MTRWGGGARRRRAGEATGRAGVLAARFGVPVPGRGTGPAPKPKCRSKRCRIPTASRSGRTSRAATAAARRCRGTSDAQAGFSARPAVAADRPRRIAQRSVAAQDADAGFGAQRRARASCAGARRSRRWCWATSASSMRPNRCWRSCAATTRQALLVVFNLSASPVEWSLPPASRRHDRVDRPRPAVGRDRDGALQLPAHSVFYAGWLTCATGERRCPVHACDHACPTRSLRRIALLAAAVVARRWRCMPAVEPGRMRRRIPDGAATRTCR